MVDKQPSSRKRSINAEGFAIARAIREHALATQPESSEHARKRDQKNLRVQWIAIASSFIAAGLNLWLLSGTLNTTREQFSVGQRAFVYLDRVVFQVVERVLPPETNGRVTIFNAYNNTKRVVAVTFYATNSGNTPTQKLESSVDCRSIGLSTPPATDPFTAFQWGARSTAPQVIGPKQTTDVGSCDLTDEDALNAHMGTVRKVLMGEIRYRDILEPDDPHVTQFSRELVILNRELDTFAAETRAVGRHNCTDQDCRQPSN